MTTEHGIIPKHISDIIALSKTNRPAAEKRFNNADKETQIAVIRAGAFEEDIITLAHNATTLLLELDESEAWAIIDKGDFGESLVLECLTPKQFMHVLDKKSWLTNPGSSWENLPKSLDTNKGFELILGIKDIEEDETVVDFISEAGVHLIYTFLRPHIAGYGSSVSLHVNPTFNEIEIKIKQGDAKFFSESDVQDLIIRIQDSNYEFFYELCQMIEENATPDLRMEYLLATERNPDWFQEEILEDNNDEQEELVNIFAENSDFDIDDTPNIKIEQEKQTNINIKE